MAAHGYCSTTVVPIGTLCVFLGQRFGCARPTGDTLAVIQGLFSWCEGASGALELWKLWGPF